jgi:hypothetical protein
MELRHEHGAVLRLDPEASRFPFLPGGQNGSSSHSTVTFEDRGSPFDAMGNRDPSENNPTSMDSSTASGCLAFEQELRDSGFLTARDRPHIGGRH